MYADSDGDRFVRSDISGIVEASSNVSSSLPLTWCKRLPREYGGRPISTEYVLIDTKRSASNYKNVIEERTARFCLDNRPNVMNTFLLGQVDAVDKTAVRLAEYLSKGSTTILDCGDHHVVGRFDKGVVLCRLKEQTPLPIGKHFKHPSEASAEEFLRKTFPASQFLVQYEPFVINFSGEAAVIDGTSVHCYNVDFRVRKRISSCNVGIEVKKDVGSWNWKANEGLFKIQKYEEILGAPCLVLVVQPVPRFYQATEAGLEPFASVEAVVDYVERASV